MQEQSTGALPIPRLLWTATIAIIVFSVCAIAVLMGWIPNSVGRAAERLLLETRSTRLELPAPRETKAPPAAPVRQPETALRSPATRPPSILPALPAAPIAHCEECGMIESIREIAAINENAGPGASGDAFPGTEFDRRARPARVFAVTVRLEDGTRRVISETAAPQRHAGEKVRIVNGHLAPDT